MKDRERSSSEVLQAEIRERERRRRRRRIVSIARLELFQTSRSGRKEEREKGERIVMRKEDKEEGKKQGGKDDGRNGK